MCNMVRFTAFRPRPGQQHKKFLVPLGAANRRGNYCCTVQPLLFAKSFDHGQGLVVQCRFGNYSVRSDRFPR